MSVAIYCSPGASFAQEPAALTAKIDTLRFKPAPGAKDLLGLHHPNVAAQWDWNANVLFHYAYEPLTLASNKERQILISSQHVAEILTSVGLGAGFEVGMVLPIVVYQGRGDAPLPDDLSGLGDGFEMAGVSDLRLIPRFQILDEELISLAMLMPVTIPIGRDDAFISRGEWGIEPRASLSLKIAGTTLLANLGVFLQSSKEVANLKVGPSLTHGIGIAHPLLQDDLDLEILASLEGEVGFGSFDAVHSPLSLLVAARLKTEGFVFTFGGGPGLNSGYGVPIFRLLLGIGYIDDSASHAQPCSTSQVDFENFFISEGCLMTDSDGDGVFDDRDRCPLEPGTREDGCPDTFKTDVEKELSSLPVASPPQDQDGDGFIDAEDLCPKMPEDMDHYEDNDGCPEEDNDNDGIIDSKDECPLVAETINAVDDLDGCPDEGKAAAVLSKGTINIHEPVNFETNSDTITSKSYTVLDQVASVLKAHPNIALLHIDGHTDDQGGEKKNIELSERRAQAVRNYLIEKGISADRLVARGFGENIPIVEGKSKLARSKNRRVEFHIVENAEDHPKQEEP